MSERTDNNPRLNAEIESFIRVYSGTAIGSEVENMFHNGCSYESIYEKLGWDAGDVFSEN